MKKLSLRTAVGAVTLMVAGALSAHAQAQQPVRLEFRIVPQTGGFGVATPLTQAGPVNGPVSMAATPGGRTLRLRIDYRILDLLPADSIVPAGLSAGIFNITAVPAGNTTDTSVAKALLSTREATQDFVPPPGVGQLGNDVSPATPTGRTGIANPFRGGFTNVNNNADVLNGAVVGFNINQIAPICLTQNSQGLVGTAVPDQGAGTVLTGTEWYTLYAFSITAGNASVGSVRFTAAFEPDPTTGNAFAYFQDGSPLPVSVANSNATPASILVNIPQIPAPGAAAVLGMAGLFAGRRRR